MAELAAVGLASSIVAFLDFGIKVATRLYAFEQTLPLGEDPKLYRDVRIELPLLLDTLKRTREQADQGKLNDATQQALLPVVNGCHAQVRSLNDLLDDLPTASDSSWRRGLKTISSIGKEKKFLEIVNRIRGYVQYLTYHQVASPTMANALDIPKSLVQQQPISKPIFMVPFERDQDYVRRADLLVDIDNRLTTQRRVALAGIGGVGKSQIAVEYCYRFKDTRPDAHVFWIFAASIPRLHQGYKAIAKILKIPGWDDLNVDSFVLIKEWMSDPDNGSWLLILDGADDMNIFFQPLGKMSVYDTQRHDMAEWLPRSPHGSIVITTRDRRLGERLTDRGKPFSIEPMEMTAAEQLFRSRVSVGVDENDGSLQELLELLGHLPLAITQAAAFISENEITSIEYLTAIKDNNNQIQEMLDQDLGDHRRYTESGSSILSTWKLSFNQILEQQPLAAKILSLMAILDLYSVPKYLLITPSTTFAKATSALGILKAFSLITVLDAGKAFEMHRLIQISVRHWLELQGTIAEYKREALQLVSDHYPVGEYENWKICEELSPHAHAVLDYETGGRCQSQQAVLLNNIGRFDSCQGRYEIARERLATALKIRKQILGKHHPDTLQTASYLGEALFRATKYTEGEEVMRYTLSGSEEVLGISDPLTRINMGHLAEMLTGQGRFDESEPLFRRALAGREEDLGTDLNDLKNADNLGAVLRRKGQYEEAESWIRRSMLGREASLGENHPETLRAVNHLGLLLRHMAKFEEAELLNRRALAGFEQTLGREHHFTLQSLDNLSTVLRCQGKVEAAEWQSRRAFSGLKRLVGEDHRHTLQAKMSLALALEAQGRLGEAASLARDVVEGERRSLGEEHPQVEVSEKALEGILRAEKREREQEKEKVEA